MKNGYAAKQQNCNYCTCGALLFMVLRRGQRHKLIEKAYQQLK